MAINKVNEIPTIDIVLLTIKSGMKEYGISTAAKIGVNVQTETQDAVKLVVKGRLLAQKPEEVTITGNTLVITDNVFTPEIAVILQGGEVKYWTTEEQNEEGTEDTGNGVARYTPPKAGDAKKGNVFETNAYSAIYNAAGVVTGYERITYPNCTGTPIALESEDGVFRAPEYTIHSAPDKGQAPYEITYIKELPEVGGVSA